MEALLELVAGAPSDLTALCAEVLKAADTRGAHDDATIIAMGRSTWELGHPLCSIAP